MAFPSTLNNATTNHAPSSTITSAQANLVGTDLNAIGVKVGSGSSVPTTVGDVLTVTSAGATAYQASAAGFTNPMTTLGDLIRGAASGVAQRLGIGSTGQVLTVVGGVPAWATPSSGSLTQTARSSGFTLASADDISFCTGTFTVTLPAANTLTSKPYYIKNVSAGVITLGGTVDGVASPTLALQYDAIILIPETTANLWRSF